MERIRLDEEPILKIGRSLITALGFESLSLRHYELMNLEIHLEAK